MDSLNTFYDTIKLGVPPRKRCYFICRTMEGLESCLNYVQFKRIIADLDTERQRVYVTTHDFPNTLDVEEWSDTYTDKAGQDVTFVSVPIQPWCLVYGNFYLQEDMVATIQQDSSMVNWSAVFFFVAMFIALWTAT